MKFTLMQNAMKQLSMVLALICGAATTTGLGQTLRLWPDQPGSTYQEWRFDSNANPASPEVNQGGGTGGSAIIAPGRFSSGWKNQSSGLGSNNTGFWDLGRSGSIVLSNALSAAVPGTSRQIAVSVTLWFDGGIYRELPAVSVSGATYQGFVGEVPGTSATVGVWLTEQELWQADAGATLNSVLITSPATGALIDSVSVETVTNAAPRAQLTIQRGGTTNEVVDVSWSTASGSGTVEWTSTLGVANSWAPVGAQPVVSGDRYHVTVPASETARFFRLKQP